MIILGIEVKDPQEIFTHLEKDTNIARTFLVETMLEFALRYAGDPLFDQLLVCARVPLKREVAAYLRTNQGIEEDRLARLRDPYLDAPIMAISWGLEEGADNITVIDGNHRYVKKAERGDESINVFIFRQDLWEQFILPRHLSEKLVNEGFLDRVSGMIEREQKNGCH